QDAIAPDGSWFVVGDGQQLVAMDPSGAEILHRDGRGVFEISRDRQIAVLDDRKIFITSLDAPRWTEVVFDLPMPHRPATFAFRGRALAVWATNGKLYSWQDGRAWEQTALDSLTYQPVEAGAGLLVVPTDSGKMYFFDELSAGMLTLPTAMRHLRIAARPGKSRLVALSDGIVLVFDLETVVPRLLPHAGNFDIAWVTDDLILAYPASDSTWRWIDVSTGKTTDFKSEARGFPVMLAVSY